MTLIEDIKALYLVDQQLRGLESRLGSAKTHLKAQQAKLQRLTEQHAELNDQLRHTQASEANLENEANAAEEHIDKLRQQMNAVKTNKEYSAMLVEVNTFKADKSKLEDEALQLMQKIEQLQEQVADVEQQVAEQEKIKELAEQKLQQRTDEIRDRLEELKAERDQAADKVPPSALSAFEKLADGLDGEAMAEVHQDDARRMEYSCGGCYMSIPPETVNRLATQDDLVYCPSCKRILYLEAETRQAMNSK